MLRKSNSLSQESLLGGFIPPTAPALDNPPIAWCLYFKAEGLTEGRGLPLPLSGRRLKQLLYGMGWYGMVWYGHGG